MSFIEAGVIGKLYESRKSPMTPPDIRRSYDTSDQTSPDTNGSYTCSCRDGFTLNADGRICDGTANNYSC